MKSVFSKQNFPIVLLTCVLMGTLAFVALSSHGQKQKAERRELVESSHDQSLQKFNLTGFDEKGKQFWNLEGDMAKIQTGDTIYLDKNVVLKLKDDTIVRTDHLQWNQSSGILRTQAPVAVDHQNTTVNGTGAFGKLNEGFVQLNHDISMDVNVTTHLTCDGPMKVFYKENKMIFFRNVRVTDQKGTLKARRMDVFFDPDQKKVDRIIAIGEVEMSRGNDHSRSQRAIYTVATGSVKLEGSPEITVHKDSPIASKGLAL